MSKTNFVKMLEMTDPAGRWPQIVSEVRKGDPIVIYTKGTAPLELLTLTNKNFSLAYTITGWGGSWLEPNVPIPDVVIGSFNGAANLLTDRVFLRVDPVIPTPEGFTKSIQVIEKIKRPVRIVSSILQLYQGHEEMAKKLHIDQSIYTVTAGRAKFVDKVIAQSWVDLVHRLQPWTKGRLQMCGMPYELEGTTHTGCVDRPLLESMGVTDFTEIPAGRQRPGCKCIVAKKQLAMGSCVHQCIYCYAHKENLRNLK